jgi:RNA polymerase sigma-70 factor, ECF subfamily
MDLTATAPPTVEQVFRDHAGFIYRVAWRVLENRDDAEDCVGEVMLFLMKKLPTFRPGPATLKTWLFHVARFTALRFRQIAARHSHGQLDSVAPRATPPDRGVIQAETLRSIDAAAERLPVPLREVFRLSDVAGVSDKKAIARSLGIALPTVYVRLNKARAAIRDEVAA